MFPFTTSISNGEATITGVKSGINLTGSLEIPPTVYHNGTTYPVTAIGANAFQATQSCYEIKVPDSVTRIGIIQDYPKTCSLDSCA
ncbi:MAG: hypothetical protein FWD58_05805 [Firmicutes bacterium]|nr:hypothetical protein [Bacillota bacterium]